MTLSWGLINLLEKLREHKEILTFTTLLKKMIKDTDKKIYRAKSGRAVWELLSHGFRGEGVTLLVGGEVHSLGSSHAVGIFIAVSVYCCCLVVKSWPHDSFVTWTVARQAPLAMWCSRQEYWSELPAIPSPGDLPDPGIKPKSPAFQVDSFLPEPPGNGHDQLLTTFSASFHSPEN